MKSKEIKNLNKIIHDVVEEEKDKDLDLVFENVPMKSLDEIIKEVAEEEGLSEKEVREMWETFQSEIMKSVAKNNTNRTKTNKKKKKRKMAKESRRRNRK